MSKQKEPTPILLLLFISHTSQLSNLSINFLLFCLSLSFLYIIIFSLSFLLSSYLPFIFSLLLSSSYSVLILFCTLNLPITSSSHLLLSSCLLSSPTLPRPHSNVSVPKQTSACPVKGASRSLSPPLTMKTDTRLCTHCAH